MDTLQALLEKVESYGFECEGGPLTGCVQWHELRDMALRAAPEQGVTLYAGKEYIATFPVPNQPSAPEHDTGAEAEQRATRLDWKVVHRALEDARNTMQAGGVRYSWMDAPCDIAKQYAAQPAHGEREPTEEQVAAAAMVIADSPLIDAPKGLYPISWYGLARAILEAALAPAKQPDAEGGQLICPRCKVDRLTQSCPGPTGNCPMVGVAQ